ncbi:CD276 antigen-like protein [Platysternon megacephalum]|uniref:CD276 antigen-like protein n=1 Tax=Platysternon megacephalum TaxID=55544 RepID=A0A4D9DNQ3_9SAUR|nr:CD276 antigen-like protein [Platysternon megacephalum]
MVGPKNPLSWAAESFLHFKKKGWNLILGHYFPPSSPPKVTGRSLDCLSLLMFNAQFALCSLPPLLLPPKSRPHKHTDSTKLACHVFPQPLSSLTGEKGTL